ncbi:MAG: ATP-dependent DNA helicase RecG [Planctomycetota bacterium]
MPTRCEIDLDAPLAGLHGLGPRRTALYAAAGLSTRRQLLYHLPVRFRRRPPALPLASQLAALGEAGAGPVATAALSGRVERSSVRRRGRRSTVSLLLQCDEGGEVAVLLFNRAYLAKSLPRGTRLWVAGRLEQPQDSPRPRLLAADYESLGPEQWLPALPPLPIYRLPIGIPPRVHRKLLAQILDSGELPEWRAGRDWGTAPDVPADEIDLLSLDAALRAIHRPTSIEAAQEGRRRLARDEAFALSLDVAERRLALVTRRSSALPIDEALHQRILALLPHVPTPAQARVIAELRRELTAPPGGRPMARLLQGDVGSGKTLVAAYALLAAVLSGRQAALMAPTELLASQHRRTLEALLAPLGEQAPAVYFLAAGADPVQLRRARAALAAGRPALAVGTHALQATRLRFADLALTVIDEQHRFGVAQRVRLREKGEASHLLVTTATPIPRTLALVAYGELDVSLIDSLPPGRSPRRTRLVEAAEQPALWTELRAAIARGERGFVVCPSIGAAGGTTEEDEESGDHSVAVTLRRVQARLGAGVRVAAVHGRLPLKERDAVLAAFRLGTVQVLVATVLIEVGLDVPEASFVVLPEPARFGLAQLHQIRGRVGRGTTPGQCLLLGPVPEGAARQRAEALVASEDGFALAERDLLLRGPGELLGTRQSGLPDFCALDPARDLALLAESRAIALAWAERHAPAARAALRRAVFPVMELRHENLLAGG